MTPKLYEEVQTFLRERWGDWGGWTQAVLFASDLPFLLASLAPQSVKPIKPTLLRMASEKTTPTSSALPTPSEEGLVMLPEGFLQTPPPPEEGEEKEEAKPVVGNGRLAFASSKTTMTTRVTRGKRGAVLVAKETETKVEVKDEVVDLGLGALGEVEGESLGERIKRRRRQ